MQNTNNMNLPTSPVKNKISIKRIWNQIKTYFSKPANIITVAFLIFLSFMVIFPLVKLVINAFTVHSVSEAEFIEDAGFGTVKNKDFTLMGWPTLLFPKDEELKAWSKEMFWEPLGMSMLMALIACLIAVLIGGVFAWLITRTNVPFKKFISTVFIFPYIMPSWSIAMFWENFFKNSAVERCHGIGLLQTLTGICAPEGLVYGMIPCALTLGIHYAPFAYILIGGILRNMDANLEEAATVLKASRFKILYRITLPIVAPAMVSTILLVFSSSLSTFTVPFKLQFNNAISIQLRGFVMGTTFKGFGYIISVILMLFSICILTINNWFTKSRKNFTTVTGKSGQISKTNLGKVGKYVVGSISIIVVFFVAIVPLISFIIESLVQQTGRLDTISLKYWFANKELDEFIANRNFSTKGVFFNNTIWEAFGRSFALSVCVALLAGTFGILIGYAVSKNRRSRITNFVSSLAFLPYLIPALSFGAIFYGLIKMEAFSFLDASTKQGSAQEIAALGICLIIGCVKFLPFASKTGTNAMLQVSGEIEEAAVINGCPWWKRMTRILFPIQKSSFISGYLLPFISCMREYTLFILVTTEVTLITNLLQYFSKNGLDQLTNAVNLLIVIFVIGANFLVNKITGASIDKGIGG